MSNEHHVMDIPGYYYDPEKKKYFKVMATGRYSRQNYEKSHNQPVTPPPPPKKRRVTPLPVYRSMRETQSASVMKKDTSTVYMGLLSRLATPQKISMMGTAALTATATARPTALDIHPKHNHLLLGLADGCVAQTLFSMNRANGYQQHALTLTMHGSDLTSIRMGLDDRCVITTMGNGIVPPTMSFLKLDLHGLHEHDDQQLMPPAALHTFSHTKLGSFWSCDRSRINPSSTILGTDSHVLYFSGTDIHTKFKIKSATLAAQIDPVQPNVFLCGGRDGHIRLYDVRQDRRKVDYFRGHGACTMKHKSAITHLHKSGSSFHVVAASMDGSLQTWDVRGQTNQTNERAWPVFRFNGHKNSHSRSHGFDVLEAANIVAVAGEDHVIRLWSLKGDSPHPFHTIPMKSAIPALKFCASNPKLPIPDRSLGMLACIDEKETPLQWLSVLG
ncbi:DDB1- and CUL4-associated factor 4 [Umbelopsis sp. WA50703]